MCLNHNFYKKNLWIIKILKKIPEQTAGISEFNSKNFIKIGQEINSGQFFEKMCVYMKYIVKILSGNRYMAHNCIVTFTT